ncbi:MULTISPECIES: PAS domain S-box protein [unclassified Neorhizobium]|uniref:PAS domain S-box protein n=1 Tax=unclassified Neorhizobium TaxID=2629175 RepID=UPI001FF571C7|nr:MULTISPECIES: PAS domain S-box protein [unclassified Neorhizobium]MCJ9672053.1 PAS domain S-box protein [Neorhizobium sp. SHOUNA12B]MCJ9746334.1 PAS domain S-box protein [Neorhizobium sp. SHOUNA12A]
MVDRHDSSDAEAADYRSKQSEADAEAIKPAHDAAAFLAAIIESSEDAIVSKSLQGIITTWNKGAERLFGYNAVEALGKPITILIPEDRLDEEPAILARIHAGERVDHFETIRRRKDGTLLDISLTISPIRNSDGKIIGASKIARDISERKRAAERQDLLLREMHHRVKNLFAITGSIITLAARTAQTPSELASSMKIRLVALSQAHEMTLPSFTGDEAFKERSTTLFQLLSSLLSPYDEGEGGRWHLHGEDAPISAERVTSLALLFHEYATNAVKYGSLSDAEGRLDVTLDAGEERFEISWLESSGRPSSNAEPKDAGFGTRLEQMIIRTLDADVSRDWQPDGLLIKLSVPRAAFAAPAPA